MEEQAVEFDALLARARAGDQEALTRLAQQYEPRLRIVARVVLGQALRPYLDSMDLVNSVHRSLLLGLREAKFDISDPEKLLALALTMVRRKAARQWRRMRRQRRLEGGGTGGEDLPDLLAALSCPHPDPAQAAQLNDQLRHLCANLDATEQRVLDLRLQGCGTEEIARAVGISHVALRVRLTRLRQRLRAAGVADEWL
jgi:RNA polymerase sigma-70 factor (ECF subfamily)